MTEQPDSISHLRQKYEKLGWSQAKIHRALEQAAASAARKIGPLSGFREDVIESLVALCQSAGSVAFVVHMYSGDVEAERFALRPAKPCSCDELSARAQSLDEDHVLIAATKRAD